MEKRENDMVESVARAICTADGCNPDQMAVGFGHKMPDGHRYALWEARVDQAEAALETLIEAGLLPKTTVCDDPGFIVRYVFTKRK